MNVSPERFRQVEEIFDAAADAPPGERASVLDRLCAGDAELRAAVEALLGALPTAPTQIQTVIGRAASEVVTEAPRSTQRRIGPYRLVCELGRGGMGAVHLAVRDDEEYQSAVAIKLLQGGLETAQAVARFRDERQILATLEHPGIVRLLDGGSTDERLPYLVMEHVVGAPLTEWADARGLDVHARVELFRKVCAAVAYAHHKLVVHRDIKPDNVLVTLEGEPKLLDFGIAKLLDPTAGREASTRTGMRLLTPEYAAPEQIRGEPVSTATDVYALGAVLYELLAGVPAQRMKGEGIEALRALLEVDPPRPSLVAPASRRRAIAGDLDNIVMKALRKEVDLRYASVEQLSDDLERHLDGLPVLARAGTWTYRVGKMVRRSRGVIAAVGIVLASLSAATVVSVRQATRADAQARRADDEARRAKKRFEEVRRLANSMLFEVDGKIENLAGATQARELIVSRALSYLDGLASEADDDPDLARELSTAYVKIGEIQGSTMVPNLGRPRDGLASYAKATRILDGLAASGHDDVATRWILLRALFGVANLHGALGDAEAMRESERRAEAVLGTLPRDAVFDYRLAARGYVSLFTVAIEDGDVAAAARYADAAREVAEQWERAAPSLEARYWLACGGEARGIAADVMGDPEKAVRDLGESIAILDRLVADRPEDAAYRRELWYVRSVLAAALSGAGDTRIWTPHVDDRTAAERELRSNLPIAERMAQLDPGDTRAALETVASLDELGAIVGERDPAAALLLFQRARAVFAGLSATARAEGYARQFERSGQCAMAVPLAKLGRRADALGATATGTSIAAQEAAAPSAALDARLAPWMCRFQAAMARHALGDEDAAAGLLEETAGGLRTILATRTATMFPYVGLVETLGLLGALRPTRRCVLLHEAAGAWRTRPAAETPYTTRRQAELDAAVAGCPTEP
jgi:eukaryotic-like serine/threonine-protein kinase